MKQIYSIFLGSLVFLVSGCSSVRIVQTEAAPEFNLSEYETFGFFQVESDADTIPDFIRRVDLVKESVAEELELKGLKQTDDQPDLMINIGIAVVEKMQTRETDIRSDAPRYAGHMNYGWESETVEVGKYNVSTVVLHLVDADDKVLLWEGIAQGVMLEKDKQAKKNIESGAKRLLKDL
jgi:hypothetical protein